MVYTHFDNDYFERARGGGAPPPPQPDPRDGHKVSDHDPMLLTLHQPVRSAEAPRGGGNEESRSGGGSTGDSGGEVAGETRSSLPPRLLPPRLFGLRVLGVPRTCAGDFVARIGLLNALSPFVRISLDGDPLERSRRTKEAVRSSAMTSDRAFTAW